MTAIFLTKGISEYNSFPKDPMTLNSKQVAFRYFIISKIFIPVDDCQLWVEYCKILIHSSHLNLKVKTLITNSTPINQEDFRPTVISGSPHVAKSCMRILWLDKTLLLSFFYRTSAGQSLYIGLLCCQYNNMLLQSTHRYTKLFAL